MRIIFLLFFFCVSFFTLSLQGQNDSTFSVYLIGDAGEDTVQGPALRMLTDELKKDSLSAVVFLGDNVYPAGLITTSMRSQQRMNAQLKCLDNYKGAAFFIPGNHDWNAQKRKGLQILEAQELYVEKHISVKTATEKSSGFYPENGLPGPVSKLVAPGLRLVIIDTQWFLHRHKKGRRGTEKQTAQAFYYSLDSILARAKEDQEQVIVAGHHPLYSNGQHAKPKQPWRFLVHYTPFRIFGLMGLTRLFSQDIPQPDYRRMQQRLLQSINAYDGIIYAAGHEHNMQLLHEKRNRFIISGSGSKLTELRRRREHKAILEDDQHVGFVRLDFAGNKLVATTVFREGIAPVTVDY
jgi:hypothetical protein